MSDAGEARLRGERFLFPGEEGRDHFHARLAAALRRLREEEGTTIAVAHGGVISAMCHLVVGLDLHRPGVGLVVSPIAGHDERSSGSAARLKGAAVKRPEAMAAKWSAAARARSSLVLK